MESGELTDGQRARLLLLLPWQNPRTGRLAKDHRTLLNDILWLIPTRSPCRGLTRRYGSWTTACSRTCHWQRAGLWDRVLATLPRAGDADGQLNRSLHFVDCTVLRVHQHAAVATRAAP